MDTLYEAITHHANTQANKVAIASDQDSLTYSALLSTLHQLASILPLECLSKTVAIDLENHAAWAVLDLSLLPHKTVTLMVPRFFSNVQIQHALVEAGASAIITDRPGRYHKIFEEKCAHKVNLTIAGQSLSLLTLDTPEKTLPKGTAKITYTSGTTGTPKGVCLSNNSMTSVAKSFCKAAQLSTENRHLSVLPLATLLENVAGLYANLFAGATTFLQPTNSVGFSSSRFRVERLIHMLRSTKANSAIVMPGMLAQLVSAYEAGALRLKDLKFLAVGSASIAPDLLKRAIRVGLPVYEGYGLSEGHGVVALNTHSHYKVGSVGKPLPHVRVKVGPNHEIFIKGSNHLGYIGHPISSEEWLPTGDIGYLDKDGFLFISGRKNSQFITSYGLNISPEWLERDLTNTAAIKQACVFGDEKPWNTALIVADEKADADSIELAVAIVNHRLPEYARISQWIKADAPFTINNKELTPSGGLKRDRIWEHYQPAIDANYAADAIAA